MDIEQIEVNVMYYVDCRDKLAKELTTLANIWASTAMRAGNVSSDDFRVIVRNHVNQFVGCNFDKDGNYIGNNTNDGSATPRVTEDSKIEEIYKRLGVIEQKLEIKEELSEQPRQEPSHGFSADFDGV